MIARPQNSTLVETRRELEAAAAALRLGLVMTSIGSAGDIQVSATDFEEALSRAKREGAGEFAW